MPGVYAGRILAHVGEPSCSSRAPRIMAPYPAAAGDWSSGVFRYKCESHCIVVPSDVSALHWGPGKFDPQQIIEPQESVLHSHLCRSAAIAAAPDRISRTIDNCHKLALSAFNMAKECHIMAPTF